MAKQRASFPLERRTNPRGLGALILGDSVLLAHRTVSIHSLNPGKSGTEGVVSSAT